ncbi:MAG: fasciclin domain-containing protein [Bacteroidia bacterium]|nr:fasciclin domain-containing protein [Bacteroidia bacterium]
MIAIKNQYFIFLSLFIGLFLSGCTDKWEDHNKIQDSILAENLLAQIKTNPDLSKFADYLNKTGYDKVVASSKTFTIWAPTNLALQNLDPAIVNDTAKLKPFVANHISNQSYLTSMPNPLLTIRTLNGKNILFTKTKFEEANIVTANRYVGNGVLHTIDLGILPKLNAWEYLNNTATSLQKTFLLSQSYIFRDSTRAVVIGIDPKTGIPILKEGTGYFPKNYFLQRVADVSNEDAKYIYVILTDAAFTAEKAKLSKYFTVNDPIKTPARNTFISDSITNWNIVKDLAFKGDYTLATLPDTLTSNDSIRIHLDKTAIVQSIKVSNGVVFIMNRIDYKMSRKIKPVIIEGEYYVSNYGNNGTRTTITRRNPNTNVDFREIYYYNTGVSSYWIKYQPTVYTASYKVYWVAVRDFNTTAVAPAVPVMFSQRLAFGTTALLPAFPYKQVDILNYNEVYLGDYTVTSYGKMDTFLVGAANTTNGQNSLVLDYIKMVPVIN